MRPLVVAAEAERPFRHQGQRIAVEAADQGIGVLAELGIRVGADKRDPETGRACTVAVNSTPLLSALPPLALMPNPLTT